MLRCCSQRRRLRPFLLRRTRSGKVELGSEDQRLALDRDDGRHGSVVPPAWRGLHLFRTLGVLLRRPRVDGLDNRSQRLRIETDSELSALLGGLGVPVAGAEGKPPVGFREVLLYADAPSVENGEIVLAVRYAVIGRLAKPTGRGLIVRFAIDSFGVKHREVVQGLGITGDTGGSIEAAGRIEVLLDPEPFFVKAPETELRGSKALFGRALKPFHRFCEILRHTATLGIAHRDLVLCRGIPFGRGRAQRSAEDGWELVGRRRRSRRRYRRRSDCGRGIVGGRGRFC